MPDEVRVGDAYLHGEDKVTISEVDTERGIAVARVMKADGIVWGMHVPLPLPASWTKVASGPKPIPEPQMCLAHPLREVEPGTFYCYECVDALAAVWAGYTAEEAQRLAAKLLREQRALERQLGEQGAD